VDVHEARALLGVGPDESWDEVRLAYRRLIRELHPDRAGPSATARAAQLNEAYGVLSRTLAGPGMRPSRRPTTTRRARSPASSPISAHIDGADTLVVDAPPDEAFTRLLEAGHAVGSVSYVDRSCAIFEVVVRHEGEACSLVVSLEDQQEGPGTEATCTLESLEQAASRSPKPVVEQLAEALRSPWISRPG
jgi:hypothetical protein